jgi:Ca2+-binding RTX toxin-like protein
MSADGPYAGLQGATLKIGSMNFGLSLISGKGDTLVVKASVSGANIGQFSTSIKFDKNGREFATGLQLKGRVAYSLLGATVAASVTVSGDAMSISLPGLGNTTYTSLNIQADLASDLVEIGFSIESATQVAQNLAAVLDKIHEIETDIGSVVPNIPGVSAIQAKFVSPPEIGRIEYLTGSSSSSNGSARNDYTFGGADDNDISGGGGNDWLKGGAGSDKINGGVGHDFLFGDEGADELRGGVGDDFLFFDAQDTFVRGGTGHDTAIVATADAVKVNLTTMQVETFVGNAGADTIAAGDAADAQFIAGGNGADIFRIGYGAGQGPRIVWGGEGVDRFYLMSPSGDAANAATTPAGILAVTVAGLTAANFAGLTLAQLGLSGIDLSKIAAIVLNPEATDRFYVDGVRINATLLKNDPNLQANDGGSVFTTRDTPILGPDLDIQGVFQDRTLIVPQPNVSFFELGEADDEFFIEVNGARVDEGNWGVVWGDGISTDVLMTLDEAQSYIDNFVSSPYWSEPTDPRAYGSFFLAGGSFTGTALAASGGFTAPTPPDTGISDWLV